MRFGTTAESPAGLAAQQVLQLTSKDLNWRMSDTLSPLRCPWGLKEGGVLFLLLSVLINPKDPHAVQLGQLGDENGQQGNGVDHKMDPVIFGVEAGENIPEYRR